MDKFFRKTKGAISIFLVLVMLPMFTCAGLIVDGARISAARTYVTGAGDLAMNAALSEYDQILKDVYGLFAMSSTTEELEANVSRYFSNTINNEGIMQGSDSYTRSFINSIGSLFSTDDVSFDNIVDTQVESFNLVEVPNSALANPTVLERQIIEYMKYRGPVSLGTGLITKLGLIGETSKQTKALEAKVDYEKKLDTVQEACETAYSAINAYNDLVSGSSKYASSDYITKMSQDISKAKTKTQEMTEYIVALNSSALKVECLYKTSYGYKDIANILIANKPLSIFNLDSDVKKAVEKHYSNSKADNKTIDTMNHIESLLNGIITLVPLSDGTYDYAETNFTRALIKLDSYYETDLSSQIAAITLHNNVPGMKSAFTYTVMYTYYYEMLSDEEKEAYSAKNDAYSMLAQIMLASSEFCSGYRNEWESKANARGKEASELLYAWYSEISGIDAALTDAIDALDAVIEKADDLDSARTNWSNKVDALSDSEVKTSMESDYSNSAKDMNEAAITALKTVLENNQTHFAKIKEKLDSIKYYDKNVCISDSGSTNYYSRYSGKITKADVSSWGEISSTASSCMSNYKSADVTTGISPEKYSKVTEDQQFYKYLKNVCATVQGESTEETTAKNNRNNLINGNSDTLNDDDPNNDVVGGNGDKSADVTGMTTGNYITDSGLTADISAAINAFASGKNAGSNSFDPTSIDSSGDDDSMADNSKSNLTEISSLLENLSKIGETARDKVYLEEYFTEMFSCYTTGKGTEDLMTLSNVDMSTNKFFGSEMEYILYGKDTVQKNLNCSKASIFGVRFALNSVYALTSSDTRTPALTAATAIAGWTGFGVPIVQTVILLAWSMAESMVDVENLCNGEAVVIYKSSDTWVLGLNGLKNEAKEFASKAVGDIFDKIENVAMDSIDSLNDEVTAYVQNTTNGLVDSIQGTIMSSIETLAVQIVGESNYNLSQPEIGARVDNMLQTMLSNANSDSTADKATRLAIDAVKTATVRDSATGQTVTIRDYLVSSIYSAYTDAKNGLLTSVSTKVEQMLTSITRPIEEKITGAVSSLGEELKTQVSQIISEGGDQVKEKVTSAIENYMGDLGGADATSGAGTSLASGFSLTYKEYIKAFMMLSLMSSNNETAMLKRCAEMIQANMAQKNSGFDISKAYTMIEVNATVSIRTTFFDIPISSGVDANGNTTYDLDFNNIGSGRQEIKYVGIIGY